MLKIGPSKIPILDVWMIPSHPYQTINQTHAKWPGDCASSQHSQLPRGAASAGRGLPAPAAMRPSVRPSHPTALLHFLVRVIFSSKKNNRIRIIIRVPRFVYVRVNELPPAGKPRPARGSFEEGRRLCEPEPARSYSARPLAPLMHASWATSQ
jgi:hypothetical protein